MENVDQNTGFRMPGLDGDHRAFTEPMETLRESPELELRHDADLVARLQQCPVTFGGFERAHPRTVVGSGRWGGHPLPPDLRNHVHFVLSPFQALGALGIIVYDPLGKSNGTF